MNMNIVLAAMLWLLSLPAGFCSEVLYAQDTDPAQDFDPANASWMRYPALSPDASTLAFVYKGDIYTVPAKGGEAKQLTFHRAHDTSPVWSHDGSKIAFASDRFGNFDIYVMDSRGGEANRVTYHSSDETPATFTLDDSHIYFSALRQDHHQHRQFPHRSQPELYSVPVNGGRVDQVLTTPALAVQLSRDGQWMVYEDQKGGENPWRKKHRSSIARDLWMYDLENDQHQQITSFSGEDRNPVFNAEADTIYFLSERNGSFNVYRQSVHNSTGETAHGVEAEQLTFFSPHPVRFLSMADNGLAAFGVHGKLYTMQPGQEPVLVDVTIRTQAAENDMQTLAVNGGIQEMAVSPNGKEIAFIARGEVFVTSKEGDFTKRLTNTPEQERFVTFTPDGNGVVYAAERNGKWSIYKTSRDRDDEPLFYASTLLSETTYLTAEVDLYQPSFSPDSSKIAYIADRRILRVQDLKSGDTIDLLDRNDLFHNQDGDQYFRWSPDSRWILVGWDKYLHNAEVLLLSADGTVRKNLTQSGYQEYRPQWMPDGNGVIWMGNRDGKRSFATSGSVERDVYAMFLTQESWDNFQMSKEEKELLKRIEALQDESANEENTREEKATKDKKDKKSGRKKNGKEAKPEKTLSPELERAEDWTARLTIHSSMIRDATLSKDGETLYYLTSFEDNVDLWKTELRTRKTEVAIRLNGGGGSLIWDRDHETLYLLSRGAIQQLDLKAEKAKRISVKGEMQMSAAAEREAMLEHIYIRTKNIFYTPDFHGNDWDALTDAYRPLVRHTGNSYEFAELVSELIGELNVSHAGARYSGSIDMPDETASLGILRDYQHEGDGIRIAEIIQGGPLDKAALEIVPGMILLSVNGTLITPNMDDSQLLNRIAGSFTQLELLDPEQNTRKQVTVKPISLSEEFSLLYERHIRMNERDVTEKSEGRLGYVHIPGMGDGPYRDIIQDILGRFDDRYAIIVDTRFNGGGDLVADLAMFFTGVKFNSYSVYDRDIGGEPTSRWTKPTLSLFNESMYSDGHCYASAYTELGIGLSVGMPVPGTCSWAGWERLPDGTRWGVVPVSAKNMSGEWMENDQTEPDVIVKNEPGVIARGRDQQLEEGIRLLLEQLDDK